MELNQEQLMRKHLLMETATRLLATDFYTLLGAVETAVKLETEIEKEVLKN